MIDILKQGIFMMNCKALFFLLLSAFPALAAPMNIGGSMDLGDPGKPVPGWTVLINRIQADAVRENPAALIQTTAATGSGLTGIRKWRSRSTSNARRRRWGNSMSRWISGLSATGE